MLGEWHYRILEQEFGPVSLDIIRELVQEDQLSAQDMVKRAVREPWQRADTYPELFPEVSLFTLRSDTPPSGQPTSEFESPAWYCLADGQLHGPVGFDLLCQWASDKRLLPDHLVRNDTSELWTEAGSIERLFGKTTTELAPPLTNPSPEEICDFLLEMPGSSSDRVAVQVAGVENSPTTPDGTADGSDEPASTVPCDETAFDGDDAVLVQDHIEGWSARVNRRSVRRLLLVSVVCVIGVIIAVMLIGNPDRRRYRLMMTIREQMQHLEQQDAGRSQWRVFLNQAHSQIDPVLAELKHSHSAAGQHLLVAGQELLQAIQFESNGHQPSDVVDVTDDFQWQMDRVVELLAGRPELDDAPVPTVLRPDEKLAATTRLYIPLMLHGKTFVSGDHTWDANADVITDIEIDQVVPVGEGWVEATATVTASDPKMLYDLRVKVTVRYRVPAGSLGTASGMQQIPYGRVTVLSIKPLERRPTLGSG